MKLDLFNLKSAEKAFFAQKLKCNFFKESDIGTSFFSCSDQSKAHA
jgi:hypothetical protein